MPQLGNPDLSVIADRTDQKAWSLFQAIRNKTLTMRGVIMKIEYNKQTHEAEPAFYFERRTLFHLHARGEEVTVTFHADEVSRARLASDETIDAGFREQIKRKPWASFPLHSTRELAPFLDLVRAKYRMISEQTAEGEATREANRFEPSERESVAPVAVAARPADPA